MFFQFKQLPFGLSSAPYIFTKVIRPLVKKWRSEGKSIVVFLDDGLRFGASLRVSSEVRSDLIDAGFVPNVQKSVWIPVQKMEWLGYDIDLVDGSFAVPQRRIAGISDGIDSIIHRIGQRITSRRVTARRVASVVGKIMSTNLVTGNMARVMTESLQVCVESRILGILLYRFPLKL